MPVEKPMNVQLSFAAPAQLETELLAVLAVDNQAAKGPDAKPAPQLLTSDAAVASAAAGVLASGEFKAGANETLLLHAPAGLKACRLMLVGLGKQAKATAHSVRTAAGTALRACKPRGLRELTLLLPEGLDAPLHAMARASVEGAVVGNFDSDTY
ncbi:MAG TPA: M17 family peptidase N-terminal domain-containing protein, partial [Terracidiphilus sp.]|nr:M17 family peptidase N-terminal domain-containing protein [Terracidiphilus sp.]